jgi:inosine-uridine nucleoside N-ribohydrolase
MAGLIPLWLDCDPGSAIEAAHRRPRRRIRHNTSRIFTTAQSRGHFDCCWWQSWWPNSTAGNVSVEKTTLNTLRVLDAIGKRNIPVVQGQAKPLLRPAVFCPEIHGTLCLWTSASRNASLLAIIAIVTILISGASGLDGVEFPPLSAGLQAVEGRAVNVMFDAIKKAHVRL